MEVLKEGLIDKPEVRKLLDGSTAWVFKVYVSTPVGQLNDDTFIYGRSIYQINRSELVLAAPENYVQLYCLEVGIIPQS